MARAQKKATEPPAPGPERMEVRLAGSGGQGLILAGLVLAEAAGLHDGRFVAMSQSYGPEARGGASKAEVIISGSEIDYPLATQVDLLLALTQEAADAYCWDLKPGSWILVDSDLVSHPPSSRAVALPFTALARDKLKKPMVANVVALGAVCQLTGVVSRRALERALLARVPKGTDALNKKALSLGVRIVSGYQGRSPADPAAEMEAEDI